MARARLMVLDDGLAPGLAGELRARGRPAVSVAELGLTAATDADVLAAVGEREGILLALHVPHAPVRDVPVAVVAARSDPARRDVVHRHASAISRQRHGRRVYA